MKFTDMTQKEATLYITEQEYLSIYRREATYERKWKLWIGLVEAGKLNPLEVTLPKFYES